MTEKTLPRSLTFSEINIGDSFQFSKTITRQDGMDFARLTGDFNPLHVDPDFAKKTSFRQNVVHGCLVGSLFSALVGMHCPGEHALYLSQTLNFRSPVFYGDTITVTGTVTEKNESIRVITMKTEIRKENKIVTSGEARVKVIGDNP